MNERSPSPARLAKSAGLKLIRVRQSKHIRYTVQAPDGRTATFTVGRSESDVRATKNMLSRLRRFARRPDPATHP
jgi:hypothetical protein